MKSACGLAVALAVSSLVGCGSVEGGKLDAAGGDAPKTADAPGDDVPSAPCDVTKPFGTPARVPGLADMDSQGWLSPDQLTIYFVRTNSTSHDDVWSGTRANTTAAFSNLAMLGGVNTNDFERRAVVTSDGLAMFVAVYEINGSVFQIKVSTRNSTTAQFSTASPVANIYSAGQGDGTPWISEDGLTILFSSLRNNADYDIFRSTRASTGATFGTPAAIAELNVADNTYPNWLSPDRCTLYFTSKRPNGSTGQDLWVATRPQ